MNLKENLPSQDLKYRINLVDYMGMFEIKYLDFYFNEKYELISPKAGHNLLEKFFSLKLFKNVFAKYSDIINPSLQNLDNLGERPIQEDFNKAKKILQEQPRLKSLLIDVLRHSHKNYVKMIKSFYFHDKYLFKKFSKLMHSAKKVDSASLLKIILKFQEKRNMGLSLFQQIQSPIDISEAKTEASIKIKNQRFTLKDLVSIEWDLFQKLNEKSKNEQQISIHNWCKQLGDLLEDQFKRAVYFIFLINHLVKRQKMYLANTDLKFLSIHNVLLLFSKDFKRYSSINKLYHLRNSIHHTNFTWENSVPIENSNIRFGDITWGTTISFEQLLVIYFKCVIFVATFELIITITHLSLSSNSKPIDQIMEELGDQLFQHSKKPIRE